MEHTYLKTFYQVVKCGSVTKAAEILCVTQPAVSRRIQLLEKTYGCTLLDRTGTILKPTPKGRVLFVKTEKILDIERELESELREGSDCLAFSLVTTPTFATVHLPKIYDDLVFVGPQRKRLKITQEHNPQKIINDMQNGVYDLAVVEYCFDCPVDDRLTKIDLSPDEIVFTLSNKIPTCVDRSVLNTLFRYPLYLHREECCCNILLEKNLEALGLSKDNFLTLIEIDDLTSTMEKIAEGEAVAFISSEVLASCVQAQRIKSIRVPGFQHQRKRSLLFRRGAEANPCCQIFIESIVKLLSSTTPPWVFDDLELTSSGPL